MPWGGLSGLLAHILSTSAASFGPVELRAKGLTRRYGKTLALDGLNLDTGSGWRCIGVLGRNGAGKSTLLRLLVGLLRPSSGELEVAFGKARYGHAGPELASFIAEQQLLVGGLTGLEHLEQVEAMNRLVRVEVDAELRDELIAQLELDPHLPKTASSMSKGTRRKLELVAAVSARTPLVVADELAEGLDVPSMHAFEAVIGRQVERGRRFVVSSHNVGFLSAVCDRVLVIDRGRCVESFAPEGGDDLRRRALEAFARTPGGEPGR